MKNANVTWTDDTLSKYLSDPKGFIPGDKMAFAGIKDPSRLGDLLAYLNQRPSRHRCESDLSLRKPRSFISASSKPAPWRDVARFG
jgi:hypothetical protein